MPDEFDFNTAPAPDEEINMDPAPESDGGPGESDDGETDDSHGLTFAFEAGGDEDEDDDDEHDDDEENEDEDSDGDLPSDDSERAFRRKVHALMSREAEESGESNSDEDDDEDEDDSDEEGFDLGPYADFEDFDDEDLEESEDDDEANSDDSWDNNVEMSPGGSVYVEPNMDQLRRRLMLRRLELAGPTTFPQFAKLPPELRLRVWEMHCPALRRKNRVVQVYLQTDGRLTPGLSLAQLTRPVRRFMRIARETRAMGLQALPDALPIGVSQHDKSVVRFNAQSDLVHFLIEKPTGLADVQFDKEAAAAAAGAKGSSVAGEVAEDNKPTPPPYANVRNLAMYDMEVRSRAPGAYYDNIYGHSMIELVGEDHASHQQPSELRTAEFSSALQYLFPNLENFYVVEQGAARRWDRWVGNLRSYQRYHVRASERGELGLRREPIEYIYCWHAPPKGRRRPSRPSDEKTGEPAREGGNREGSDPSKDGDQKNADNTEDSTRENGEEKNEDDGDFKDECVINHFAAFREKGVRFSRLLIFELEEGLGDYHLLQAMCRPLGKWPTDEEGQPVQDSRPTQFMDQPGEFGEQEEDDDEFVSDGGSDEEEEDGDDGDSSDEDDLAVVRLSDEDDDDVPLEAMFSSPDAESEPEPETAAEAGTRCGKKRRVVTDSDDEDGGEGGSGEEEAASESASRPRAKRRRRAALSSDEGEGEDEDGGGRDAKAASTKNAAAPTADDSEDVSSHTAEGDDSDESDEEEDDDASKPLTLAQRLQLNRRQNPLSDEEVSGSGSSGEDDGEEGEEYAGDYGADGQEDEDDDEEE